MDMSPDNCFYRDFIFSCYKTLRWNESIMVKHAYCNWPFTGWFHIAVPAILKSTMTELTKNLGSFSEYVSGICIGRNWVALLDKLKNTKSHFKLNALYRKICMLAISIDDLLKFFEKNFESNFRDIRCFAPTKI